MGWLGFTLDSPISHTASAYDKMNRSRSDYRKGIPLPKKPKPPKDKSSSFLSSIRKSVSKSASPSIAPKPSSNLNTPFLKLPPKVREQIYGYVVGKEEVLHVLLRKRTASKGYYVGFRRCRAAGGGENCVMRDCRLGLDVVNGVYASGFLSSCAGFLLTCRDIYKEASQLLYAANSFDFDHPLSLIIFTQQIPPSSLHSIRSISLELGEYLYHTNFGIRCKSFHSSQWAGCWEVIARMEGLEAVTVRFRSPIKGWLGMTKKEVLEPLWMVGGGMEVFEVEAPDALESFGQDGDEAPFTLIRGD